MQSAQLKISGFYWPYGDALIYINTVPYDYGTVDLCATTTSGQFNCYGQQNWSADSKGFATAYFSQIPKGSYTCADSIATSGVDQYRAYAFSKNTMDLTIYNSDWMPGSNPIDFQC
jgi:hypothetical protein